MLPSFFLYGMTVTFAVNMVGYSTFLCLFWSILTEVVAEKVVAKPHAKQPEMDILCKTTPRVRKCFTIRGVMDNALENFVSVIFLKKFLNSNSHLPISSKERLERNQSLCSIITVEKQNAPDSSYKNRMAAGEAEETKPLVTHLTGNLTNIS
jgi:hypothetical protein